jgi:hypothetical protein
MRCELLFDYLIHRELQSKAEEREMAFMQKLGIDPSRGRITIAPRES